MHMRCGRPYVNVFAAKVEDFTRPQSHLDHDRPNLSKDRRRCLQIFTLLAKGKRPFSSLFVQELNSAAEEGTPLDQFLLHSNPKDLPQTRQIAVDRRGA